MPFRATRPPGSGETTDDSAEVIRGMQHVGSTRLLRGAAILLSLALAFGLSGTFAATAQEAERDEAANELDDLRGDLSGVIDRYNDLQDQLATIRSDFNSTERRVRKLAGNMLQLEDRAVEMAQSLYKGGSIAGLESLLTADSIGELQTQMKYLESTGRAGLDVFGRLAADRRALEEELDELDAARAATQDAVDEMISIRSDLEGRIADQRDEIEALDAELAAQAEEVVSSPSPVVVTAPPPPSAPAAGQVPDWDAIAMCESGGNWHLDSTYDGGLQFHPDTWLAYGGGKYARYAWQASREEQIAIAERVLDGQGPGAWPNCFVWK